MAESKVQRGKRCKRSRERKVGHVSAEGGLVASN